MYITKSIFLLLAINFALCSNMLAQTELKKYATDKGEVAVGGNDITTYFDNDLSPGKKEISLLYDGIRYQFANKDNLEKFKKNPGKYLPAYGGWCAMALCEERLVEPNPDLYAIIDEKPSY